MILKNLQEITNQCSRCKIPFRKEAIACAMFDLTNSTQLKLDKGQHYGNGAAIVHNKICISIAEIFGGILIKEIGDEVLIIFSDPLKAAFASINIKKAFEFTNLTSKGTITWGEVDMVRISKRVDVFGTPVDLCARIIACAKANQFLLDSNIYHLIKNNKDIKNKLKIFTHDFKVKNFKQINCYELEIIDLALTV